MSGDYRHLIKSITGDNGELVWEFFAVFSLFECALKKKGFCTNHNDRYKNAQADWCKFAKEKQEKLATMADKGFTEAKSYLLQNHQRRRRLPKSDISIRWKKNSKRSETDSSEAKRKNNTFCDWSAMFEIACFTVESGRLGVAMSQTCTITH